MCPLKNVILKRTIDQLLGRDIFQHIILKEVDQTIDFYLTLIKIQIHL